MLKAFRENLKHLKWVLLLVIVVLILFLFETGGMAPTGGAPNDTAITVGDREVTFSELQQAYQRTENLYRQAYGEQFTPELIESIGLPQQVMQSLVDQKLLLAEAERMGLATTDSELQEQILEFPAFKNEDGAFVGTDDYDRILRTNGYTPESFEDQMRQDLLIQKVREVVAGSVWISDEEVEKAYRDQTERATVRYLRLPAERFADEVEITEDEIAAYFAENQEDFRIPEQRVVDYLLVDTAQVRAGLGLSEEELRDFYQINIADFAQDEQVRARHILIRTTNDLPAAEAEAKLNEIKAEIEAGGDFTAIASENSDDESSARNGGDLGYFGRGEMVGEFEQAAFDAPVGSLVGPVMTAFGYHLIEVLDHRPAGTRSFEEVGGQIEARLLAERTRTTTEALANELAERGRNEGLGAREGFEQLAAETASTQLVTTPAFSRTDNIPEIGRSGPFTAAAFELEPGQISEPVQTPRGWAVLRLVESLEPRIPEIAEIETEVREALERRKRVELARVALADEAAQLEEGGTLDAIAEGFEIEIEEPAEFARTGSVGSLGAHAELIDLALSLDEGSVGGPLETSDGVVLFEVTGRKRFDPAEFEAQKDSTRDGLKGRKSEQLLTSLLATRRDEIEVTYNPAILDSFNSGGIG